MRYTRWSFVLFLLLPLIIPSASVDAIYRTDPDIFPDRSIRAGSRPGPEETMKSGGRLVIDLEFSTPWVAEGEYGSEIRMEGVQTDPRTGSLRLPRSSILRELPLNSEITSLNLLDPKETFLRVDNGIARSPGARPLNYPELCTSEQEPVPPPERYIGYDLATGIDPETDDNVAKLSVFVHPVVPAEGGFRILLSAALEVLYEFPETTKGPVNGDIYEMLIICPDLFRDDLEEFADYRNATGTTTRVVTLGDISDDSIWTVEENDTQEEIKRFVYLARLNWQIEYVMLAGDVNRIPCRHIMVLDSSDDSGTGYTDGRFVPSDLYFSDIFEDGTTAFSSWNDYTTGDHSLLYGEYAGSAQDDPDLVPDLYVGRLPAGGLVELRAQLGRIRNYEIKAKDSVWFENATICGTNTFSHDPNPEGEIVSELINTSYMTSMNVTTHYETDGTLQGIPDTVDQGCGFFNMANHGGYDGWGYVSGQPVAYDSTDAFYQDNGYKLPVVVLDACLASGFDNENASDISTGKDPVYGQWYYPPGYTYRDRDCLAEYLHKGEEGGGIATFGSTRVGWGAVGSSFPYTLSGYMDVHINKAYSDGHKRPGKMLAVAQDDYVTNIGVSGSHHYKTVTEYILLGDPSLNIGGITVTNADVEFDDDSPVIQPGENVTIGMTINNTGKIGALFRLSVGVIGNDGHVWTANISREETELEPGETSRAELNISAPINALAGETRDIEVSVNSLMLSRTRNFYVTPSAARTVGIGIEASPPLLTVVQGDSAVGFVNITNNGNGEEFLFPEFRALPDRWDARIGSYNISVGPRDMERVPIEVTAANMTVAGTYDIDLNITSNITGATDEARIEIDVPAEHGLSVSSTPDIIEADPDSSAGFNLSLSNLGNIEETVELHYTCPSIPSLGLSFSAGSPSVHPFSTRDIEVTMDIPNGTPPGPYMLTIRAEMEDITEQEVLTLNISRLRAYSATGNRSEGILGADNSLELSLDIENLGNVDDRFDMEMTGLPGSNWSASFSPSTAWVDPGETMTIRVSVMSDDPLNTTLDLMVKVIPHSGLGTQVVPLRITVPRKYNHSLSLDMPVITGKPGDTLHGRINLDNLANCNDTFSISGRANEDWPLTLSEIALDLDAYSSGNANLSVSIPEGEIAGTYSIMVMVTSLGSDSLISLTQTIYVDEVRSIDLVSALDGSVMKLRPGNQREINITVINGGNAPDTVNIRVLGPDSIMDWITVGTSVFSDMEPGERRYTIITVMVPNNATPGSYRFSIYANSEEGTDPVEMEVPLEVKEKDDGKVIDVSNLLPIIIVSFVGLLLIIVVIFVVVREMKKRSGKDLEELGMEWEGEGDEEWDEW